MRISEEDATDNKKTRSTPDTDDDTDKFQHPFLATEIPSLFSQNNSRNDRPLSNVLRATSGRGGAVSRQFLPPSDFAPLSVTNRSAYGTEHSVRFRDVDPRDNVTRRETKRPQERPRDKEYRRRFSSSSLVFEGPEPRGGQPWPHTNGNDRRMPIMTVERGETQPSPSRSVQFRQPSPAHSVLLPLTSNLLTTGSGRQCPSPS
jgi:hypothetical protein